MTAKTLGLLGILFAILLPVWREPPATQDPATTFGFQVGEERRYVLGPPETLRNGESATWTISLGRLSGPDPDAVFQLQHERSASASSVVEPQSGEVLSARVEGELTVNPHGFPKLLRFTVSRRVYGLGDERFSVTYRYEDRRYLKEVRTVGNEWTISIPVSGHKNLDKSVPTGLYLFSLSAVHCLTPSSAGSQLGNLFVGASEPCDNNDPALLNPGLFSLALPVFWEGGGNQWDYLFFMPTGPDLYPGFSGGSGFGFTPSNPGPGVSGNVGSAGKTGDIDKARNARRYYESVRVRLTERTKIEMGRRRLDAWRLLMDGPLREIFIDDEGKVLRVSLPPAAGGESRWIRLLLPSEY